MRSLCVPVRLAAVFASLIVAACAGGSPVTAPVSAPQVPNSAPGAQAFAIGSPEGVHGTIRLRADRTLPVTAVQMEKSAQGRTPQSVSACPSIPTIRIVNPFPFPLQIRIVSFELYLPCTPAAPLLGATFYQVRPQPKLVSPVKIGDAAAAGMLVTFTAAAKSITLAPYSLSQIVVLPETSTASVAFPVAPGSQTELTANAPSLPSGLTFTYTSATGGSTYSAACFNAYASGVLAPALDGVPLVGTPSFYCHLDTGSAAITFGRLVTFNVIAPKPDRAIFEPDGAAQGFACTVSSSCNVPQFSVPTTYQNFIVGNVKDLTLCVPATPNLDCNGVPGDPQGNALGSVPADSPFQLLVADDPTYKPGSESAPVPWDGLFRISLSGSCRLESASGAQNGDAPPQYTDGGATGTGPYAEYDLESGDGGTCGITVSEDPRYITDYSDPAQPHARSAALTLTIGSTPAPY